MGSSEAAVLCAGNNRMQSMTKLVEQGFYVLMCQQGGLVGGRRRKIEKQSDCRWLVFSIRQHFSADDVELCEVIEFSFAWKHIELEHAKALARGGSGNDIKLTVIDPFVGRDDHIELQTEN